MKSFLILFCVAVFTITWVTALEFRTINSVEYMFSFPIKKNWHQAQRYCQISGMTLAEVTTLENSNAIKNALNEPGFNNTAQADDMRWWIGGTDFGSKGVFYWIGSGYEFDFDDFNAIPSQPDNFNDAERCIEMSKRYDFRWNDYVCDRRAYFICQRQSNCKCLSNNDIEDIFLRSSKSD